MIQLGLLLLGVEAVRRHWVTLAVAGFLWTLLGVVILAAPLEGIHAITMQALSLLLVIEGVVTLTAGFLAGARGRLWLVKALALIVPGVLIAETPLRSVMLISILFGVALSIDGAIRLASTLVVRFPGWRVALVASGCELVLALLALLPWPVSYEATVPFCVGLALVSSGWTMLRSALLLHRLSPDAPITSLPLFEQQRGWSMPLALPGAIPLEPQPAGGTPSMIVHVWTPVGSAAHPMRRPVIDRYLAVVDRDGSVSTGHAALELLPDLYISHYRLAEQDRTGQEFRLALHGGARNDVAGMFQPGYRAEVAEWWEADQHVAFRHFNAERLRSFWAAYRQDATYNLTNRNCSVVVAMALDAALEGVVRGAWVWPPLLRLLVHPDLFLATLLRKRAWTLTWTPGLVLDYARALQRVVDPPELSWLAMLRQAIGHYRRVRREHPLAVAAAQDTG